jgi:hypothetical protein
MDDADHDLQRRLVTAKATGCLNQEDVHLMPSRFDEIWLPRIGERATAELRRSVPIGMVMVLTVLAMGIACGFAFGRGTPGGVLLGCVEVMIGIVAFAVLIRSRMRLAEAISQWFGIKIGSRELPNMRTKQFDAWCQRRNLRSPRQQQL